MIVAIATVNCFLVRGSASSLSYAGLTSNVSIYVYDARSYV